MASKMKETSFKDFITLKRGYDLPAKNRIPGTSPIISSSGITGFHNDFKVQGPGVITGRSGLIGKTFYTKKDFWPLNTTLYVKDFKNNNPEYVYYFLKTLNLSNYQSGSSVPTLNRNHLDNVKIRIHDIKDQAKISDILSKIDEKVEINNKIIANLEELSQTLFKRWFIDFEFPNDNGNPYKSSGGKMKISSIGEIPQNWKVYSLGEIASSISKSLDKKNVTMAKFLNTSDILKGSVKEVGLSPTNDMPGQAKKLIEKNDILYSEIRPKNKRYAYVDFDNPKDYVVSTKLMVLRVDERVFSSKLLYLWLSSNETIDKLQNIAENRSGTFPQITFNILSNFKFALPDKIFVEKFEDRIIPFLDLIKLMKDENNHLISLRNTLLPKLMSGEIELPEELEV